MRNPVPACNGFGEFSCGDSTKPSDFQFPPPLSDLTRPGKLLGGFGGGECYVGQGATTVMKEVCGSEAGTRAKMFQWNLADKVVVPRVPPGDYVMSFRWDCEGTDQVWGSCSDVTITSETFV